MNLILPVALAILGIGGTLLGTLLGSQLARRNEARHWRRERCLEAYTDVLRACDVLVDEATGIYAFDPEGPNRLARSRLLTDGTAEMYRASDRATLLCSDYVQTHLDALCLHCGKKIGQMAIANPKPAEDEWRRVRLDEYAALYVRFRNEARNDLGVNPPRHNIAEWKEILGR